MPPRWQLDIFPTLEICPYLLPKILFTTPFVHGLPVREGRPSAFKASQTRQGSLIRSLAREISGFLKGTSLNTHMFLRRPSPLAATR